MAYPTGADFHMDIDTNVDLFQWINEDKKNLRK
jgi:hypothetical protein